LGNLLNKHIIGVKKIIKFQKQFRLEFTSAEEKRPPPR
jgi:hypothetical protein